jgi:dihydroorotate dehydrogenase electron transfer subunit
MLGPAAAHASSHVLASGLVTENARLCDEHFRITFRVASFPAARPGQFVHLGTQRANGQASNQGAWRTAGDQPFLRRAFSIAGLRRGDHRVDIDVIYRVVGRSTIWLAGLRPGDYASVLGPQGNSFPILPERAHAWLVAGGVGLPPLLWFAEELRANRKATVFLYGAQRADLVAMRFDPGSPPAADACAAVVCTRELAPLDVPVVVSTDDGSLGFRGHVGQALETYWAANPIPGDHLALYTCGPERMMHYVARFADRIGAACYACVERSMACATGMCQSCVVPVKDPSDRDGWRYDLCCTDGPVFDSRHVIWDFDAFVRSHKLTDSPTPACPSS